MFPTVRNRCQLLFWLSLANFFSMGRQTQRHGRARSLRPFNGKCVQPFPRKKSPLNRIVTLTTTARRQNDQFFCTFTLIVESRILQVVMLRAKFGRIKIRTNLLQRFDNNFGHFDNKFCYKIDKFQTKSPNIFEHT